MEAFGAGCRNVMEQYFLLVQILTADALRLIKENAARNNVQFDDSFQRYFLRSTNAQIAKAYTDFVLGMNCGSGQFPSNQDVHQQSHENGMTRLSEMLAAVVQSSIQNASMPVVVISGVNDMSNGHQQLSPIGGGYIMDFNESQEGMVNSSVNESGTIDLTLDEAEGNSVIVGDQSEGSNALVENSQIAGSSDKNDAHKTNEMIQTKSSNTQRKKAANHNDGVLLQNTAGGSDDSQQSEMDTPDNANDEVTEGGDDLEIAMKDGAAADPNANHQMSSVSLPENTIEIPSHRKLRGKKVDLSSNNEYLVKEMDKTVASRARRKVVSKNSTSGYAKKNSKLGQKVNKVYICAYCMVFSTNIRTGLVRHFRTHTKERPYKCEICLFRFSRKHDLKNHMKRHAHLYPFQCSNCRQGFSEEASCDEHEKCCKLKQYECYLCRKKCSHKSSSLFDHMRRHHTGEKPFGCSNFPTRFYFKYVLKDHMKRFHENGN